MSEGLHGAVAKQSTAPGLCSLPLPHTHTGPLCPVGLLREETHVLRSTRNKNTSWKERPEHSGTVSAFTGRGASGLEASELLCALTHRAAELPALGEMRTCACLFPTINRGNGSAVVQVYFTFSTGSYCCSRPSDESQYLSLSL